MRKKKRDKKKRNIIVMLSIIIILVAAILIFPLDKKKREAVVFITENEEIKVNVEVADTILEHTRGLMNRDSLNKDSGMLFIFQEEAVRGFWMKNTYIPLDIIFIDSNFKIVNIAKNVQPCNEDPCETYSSEIPIVFVVEVNGGFTEKEGIAVGDTISFIN